MVVAVELNHAVLATDVANDNTRHRISDPVLHAGVSQVRMRYRTGAPLFPDLWRTQQQTLHTLAGQFSRFGPDHAASRVWEPLASPPARVDAGRVHGDLECTGPCLAKLVACHEQAFAELRTNVVELHLLGIGPVGCQLVSLGPDVFEAQQLVQLPLLGVIQPRQIHAGEIHRIAFCSKAPSRWSSCSLVNSRLPDILTSTAFSLGCV